VVWLRVRAALLVVPLVAATALAGCAGRVPAPASAHVLEVDDAFLWRVLGDGDAEPLYLLGSIHLLDVPLEVGPRLSAIFADSREVLIEIDGSDVDPLAFLETAAQLGRLAPLQSLDDSLDEESRARLDRFLEEHPVPPMLVWDVDHTAPWLLWFWVTVATLDTWGFDPGQGVEAWFLRSAGDARPVVGLETPAEQFEAMAAVPLEEQGQALAEVLRSWEAADQGPDDELVAVLAAWKAGDDEALRAAARTTPGFERELLLHRNERMASRLADRVAPGGPRFAIVGALHLVGEGSILDGLRLRGLRVERVR